MNGKSKCKILKDIRRQIAKENDIDLVISECKYQGDCAGTCPKCEAEVRYLEQELRKRQLSGKAIAVAGIAAALVVSSSGCVLPQTAGSPLPETTYSEKEAVDGEILPLPGMIAAPTEATTATLMGDLLPDMGDIPDPTETTQPHDGAGS